MSAQGLWGMQSLEAVALPWRWVGAATEDRLAARPEKTWLGGFAEVEEVSCGLQRQCREEL